MSVEKKKQNCNKIKIPPKLYTLKDSYVFEQKYIQSNNNVELKN